MAKQTFHHHASRTVSALTPRLQLPTCASPQLSSFSSPRPLPPRRETTASLPCAHAIVASAARAMQQHLLLLARRHVARSTRRRPLPVTCRVSAVARRSGSLPPPRSTLGVCWPRASGRARSSSPRRSGRPRRSRAAAASPPSRGASTGSPWVRVRPPRFGGGADDVGEEARERARTERVREEEPSVVHDRAPERAHAPRTRTRTPAYIWCWCRCGARI